MHPCHPHTATTASANLPAPVSSHPASAFCFSELRAGNLPKARLSICAIDPTSFHLSKSIAQNVLFISSASAICPCLMESFHKYTDHCDFSHLKEKQKKENTFLGSYLSFPLSITPFSYSPLQQNSSKELFKCSLSDSSLRILFQTSFCQASPLTPHHPFPCSCWVTSDLHLAQPNGQC